MVPADDDPPTVEAAMSLVGEAAGERSASVACARFQDPSMLRVAPVPLVRAAVALFAGTIAEPLTTLLAEHRPIRVGTPMSPGRVIGLWSDGDDVGSIVVNGRYAAEHPALIMPSLAHALLWTGPGAGEAEEVLLHAIVALLHVQSIARWPALAHLGTELCRRQNSLAITLLNSRRPDDATIRLYAPDGLGTIPGGAPSMQTPDFASIPFASGADPERPAPAVLNRVLEGLVDQPDRPFDRSDPARYDEALVMSVRLSVGRAVSVVERLRAAVAIGLLGPADLAEISERRGVDASVAIARLGLADALACWPDRG